MKKPVILLVSLAAAIAVASCVPYQESPGTIMPAPPPQPPEPVLVRNGPMFAYDTGSGILTDLNVPNTIQHEIILGHVGVRVRTPLGWTASDAGYAAWFQRADDSTRFVVYPVADHASEFRTVWYDRDVSDPAVRVSPIQSFESVRHPLLYTYERTDDGRHGIVYAMLSDPSKPGSGILVHGVWSADQDRALRPIVVAAANGVVLAAR
ncbi:MAG: hypothetical protein RL272_789 [Candidatus Parcubacteria bacterium]|jgi:hypothetical protein